jgi:branched-chain amino acid transport system permease protein
MEFAQQLLNGISLGAIYALIALGYTMVYGVLRFINFAHSDVFMLGAYAGWTLAPRLGGGTFAGGLAVLAGAMAITAALGVIIEKVAYRPLRNRSTLTVLITAIGVSLLIQNVAQNQKLGFGPNPKAFPAVFPQKTFTWEVVPAATNLVAQTPGAEAVPQVVAAKTLSVNTNQAAVLFVSLALLAALHWIVNHTKIGTAMRAVSFNATAASLVGINNDAIISFTFALGSALAGAGGILYAMNYPTIDPLMGTLPGLKAFVAAVLGGIGNLPGAALGGLLIGLMETFVKGSRWSTYSDAIAFAILILILLFRPAGLLGKLRVEKV